MVDYNKIQPLDDPAIIFDISGKVGLITGGGGKMGQQFAVTLSRAGSIVIIADKTKEICNQAADNVFKLSGIKPYSIVCDVSDEKSVDGLFDKIEKKYNRLDYLVYNVMGKPEGYYRPFEKYSIETWNKIHDINLTGTFLCCRKSSNIMAKNNGGSIVITSSIYGVVAPDFEIYKNCSHVKNPYGGSDPLTVPGAYASSKGGLIAFAKYLAVLLASKKIRVNILTPGGVYDGQEETFHQEYIKRTPLRRMGVWSDYNGAIMFLVSEASRYMTGANLIIDGGWTAW